MTDRMESRRSKLRRLISKEKVDALLVTNFSNVTYLTGFTGDDSYLLVMPDRELLVDLPMTANPGLADRGAKGLVRRGLDRFFALWWRFVRRACG